MSEMGELKKRIKKVLEWHDEAAQNPERDKIMTELVSEILEDIKEEFPIEKFEYKEPTNLPLGDYKLLYEKVAHQMLEVLHWYNRYFGE